MLKSASVMSKFSKVTDSVIDRIGTDLDETRKFNADINKSLKQNLEKLNVSIQELSENNTTLIEDTNSKFARLTGQNFENQKKNEENLAEIVVSIEKLDADVKTNNNNGLKTISLIEENSNQIKTLSKLSITLSWLCLLNTFLLLGFIVYFVLINIGAI